MPLTCVCVRVCICGCVEHGVQRPVLSVGIVVIAAAQHGHWTENTLSLVNRVFYLSYPTAAILEGLVAMPPPPLLCADHTTRKDSGRGSEPGKLPR